LPILVIAITTVMVLMNIALPQTSDGVGAAVVRGRRMFICMYM
jgi:hypothetical protein